MSKSPKDAPQRPVHYTSATETTFRAALASIEKTLPDYHGSLARLLEDGQLHLIDAVQAVLEGRRS